MLTGGLQCRKMLAFHGESSLPQTKLPLVLSPLVLRPLQEQICCSLLRVCEDRVGEKDMSCHCFMKNRFFLNAHFLCKASPESPVLFVSLHLKALKCFLFSEEMHSLNGREGGQNESYLSYLVEHHLLIILTWSSDVLMMCLPRFLKSSYFQILSLPALLI